MNTDKRGLKANDLSAFISVHRRPKIVLQQPLSLVPPCADNLPKVAQTLVCVCFYAVRIDSDLSLPLIAAWAAASLAIGTR